MLFTRSRSTQSYKSSVTQADIEEFGLKKFQQLSKQNGKRHALEQVESHRATITQEASMDQDDDEFTIEDTDVWFSEESVECVLGAI
jgi:hypothetical protein